MEDTLLAAIYDIKSDLKGIDARIDTLDDRWDKHITNDDSALAKMSVRLETLSDQIKILTRLLMEGNGQKSVLAQLEHLHTEVHTIQNTLSKKEQFTIPPSSDIVGAAVANSKKEKYIMWGKVVGVLVLVLPGILSFLSTL